MGPDCPSENEQASTLFERAARCAGHRANRRGGLLFCRSGAASGIHGPVGGMGGGQGAPGSGLGPQGSAVDEVFPKMRRLCGEQGKDSPAALEAFDDVVDLGALRDILAVTIRRAPILNGLG